MVPLLVLAPPPLDPIALGMETAAGATVLWAFDVEGPYRVLGNQRIVEKGSTVDSIEVSAGDGRKYRMVVLPGSRLCQSVSREQGLVSGSRNPPPPSMEPLPADRKATIRRGLDRLGLLRDFVNPFPHSTEFRQRLTHWIGYGGHPFFGPVQAYVDVSLDRESGAFTGFHRDGNPPEADRTLPRLSLAQAIEAARRYLATHEVRYYPEPGRKPDFAVGYAFPELMPYERSTSGLGWIVPRGGSKAHLAWAVPYWDRAMETPQGRDAAGYVDGKSPNLLAKLYIDAATGERVLSDDVPMERYP